MPTLTQLFNSELPLNRKERFYTGTVFPMIVCRDNFRNFHILLELLGCKNYPDLKFDPEDTNVQFFTEYSLKESLFGVSKNKFQKIPKSKETPDIIILIKGDSGEKILVILEAKMFDNTTASKLEDQLNDQQEVIVKNIANELNIEKSNIFHFALIPEELFQQVQKHGFSYPTLTWDDLLSEYRKFQTDDYFMSLLEYALVSYSDLVSYAVGYGQNNDGVMKGLEIYNKHKQGNNLVNFVGRNYGLHGDEFSNDIRTGNWEKQKYEISFGNEKPNRNWFSVDDFIDAVTGKIPLKISPQVDTQLKPAAVSDPNIKIIYDRIHKTVNNIILKTKEFKDLIPIRIWFGKSGTFKQPNFQIEFDNGNKLPFRFHGKIFGNGKPFNPNQLYGPYRWEVFEQNDFNHLDSKFLDY
jgi:hypothetical protein